MTDHDTIGSRLRAVLDAPPGALDDESFDAALIRQFLIGLIVIASLGFVSLPLAGESDRLPTTIALVGVALVGFLVVQRWGARVGAWFLVFALQLFVAGIVVAFGGLRDPSAGFMVITIAVAGVVLGRPGVLFATASVLALVSAIFGLELAGAIDEAPIVERGIGFTNRAGMALLLGLLLVLYLRQRDRMEAQRTAAVNLGDETRRFYESVLGAVPVSVAITDAATGAWIYTNAHFTRTTGLTPEAFAAATPAEREALIHPDDRAEALSTWMKFIAANGEDETYAEQRYRYRTSAGWRWHSTRATVLDRADDGTIRQVMFSGVDVSRQIDADAQRDAILDAVPAMVTISDFSTGHRTFVSPEFTRVTGLDVETFANLTDEDRRELIHPDDRAGVDAAWQIFQASNGAEEHEVTYRFRTVDGWRWFLTRPSVLSRLDDGRIDQFMVSGFDISKERQAEAARSAALANSLAMVSITDVDTQRVEFANKALTSATGYSLPELQTMAPRSIREQFLPDHDRWQAAIGRAITTTTAQDLEHRVRYADGSIHTLITRIAVFAGGPDGTTAKIHQSSFDISDLVEAETESRTILDANPSIVLVLDADGPYTEYANPAFTAATGYSADDLNILDRAAIPSLVHPDDLVAEDQAIDLAIATGQAVPLRHRVRTRAGGWRWFDTQYLSFPDAAGTQPRRVLINSVDITDRVEAEGFQTAVLELTPAMTVVFDIDTATTLYVNAAYTAQTGLTADAANALDPGDLSALTPPEDRHAVDEAITKALTTDEVTTARRRYRVKSGEYRWFDTRFLRFPDPTGRYEHRIVSTAIDVTEHRAIEEALATERSQLERANRDLQDFVYIASHDLQEPLRTISAFSDLLREELPDNLTADAQTALRFVGEGATRMRALVAGLLELSRIGDQRAEVPVDTRTLVAGLLDDLHDLIEREAATVTVGDLPTVVGDPTELRLVFQNLVTNAIKFHDPVRPPEVTIDAQTVDGHWRFEVVDNGIGIEPRHHDRIFTIFQRLHPHDAFEGVGIGLAHAKRAIEDHHGELGVESTVGVGSTFWFTIPNDAT